VAILIENIKQKIDYVTQSTGRDLTTAQEKIIMGIINASTGSVIFDRITGKQLSDNKIS
jgi:hypothetical protein